MKPLSIAVLIVGMSAVLPALSSSKVDLNFKNIYQIAGQEILEEFISKSQLTVVYYYKKDMHRIRFFFKELDKSAEYLELYGVKVGMMDCTAKENKDVRVCDLEKVEDNVYTYRNGNQLLALEFDTMFDVNSIMSNVLQLVMLRQVPIVQSPKEVRGLLNKMRGKLDVIFGHMKAIGTFDHRVFMEVAYAYQDKFKFALCTDEQAITAFSELPAEDAASNIYVVFTKDMEDPDVFHSIKYRADLTLPAFAKFLMLLSLPKQYAFPEDGIMNPYVNVDAPAVLLYYGTDSEKLVKETATLISNYYWGTLTLTLIDMDEIVSQESFPYEGKLPSVSLQLSAESPLEFMQKPFSSENIAHFLETSLQSKKVKLSEEDRQKDYDSPAPPEIHEDAPYIDHEALEVQDDEVADAVRKNKTPMPLDLVAALTDKTFHTTIQSASVAVVYFYFPFDAMNMAFLRKYGEAADRLGKDTKLSISRVNCYDWTDVCSLNNITIYPTLRVFLNGQKSWDYRGPRDSQELYSTFRILELSPPVHVTDPATVKEYLLGNMNSDVKSFSSVVVVGLFTKENRKEIEAFSEVAKESRDRILFVYSDVEDTKKIASQFNAKVPAVILAKYDDSIQPHVVYSGKYEEDSLRNFIQEYKLPKLTTLTPLVFPELYKRGSDFVILFTDDSPKSQDHENVMREVLKTGMYNNVSFTLMPVSDESSVGYKVLHQYTPEPTVPFISYVNLKMGEVFNYEAEMFQKQHLMDWISSVLKRNVGPSSVLKDNEWKPVQRGYDFLKITDWEKAQAKQKQKKLKESEERWEEQRDDPEAEGQPPIDGEDEDARQELIELHNSRLYNKSPHKHAGGKESGTSQTQEPAGTSQKQEPIGTSQKKEPAGRKEKMEHKHVEL